jgi:putative alpha-1,2-mannosidase
MLLRRFESGMALGFFPVSLGVTVFVCHCPTFAAQRVRFLHHGYGIWRL